VSALERLLESGLPLATAILAIIPFAILLLTYTRTKSKRILLAASAFGVFVIKGIVLSAGLLYGSMSFEFLELMEFGTDFLIILLFAASFLWSFRE